MSYDEMNNRSEGQGHTEPWNQSDRPVSQPGTGEVQQTGAARAATGTLPPRPTYPPPGQPGVYPGGPFAQGTSANPWGGYAPPQGYYAPPYAPPPYAYAPPSYQAAGPVEPETLPPGTSRGGLWLGLGIAAIIVSLASLVMCAMAIPFFDRTLSWCGIGLAVVALGASIIGLIKSVQLRRVLPKSVRGLATAGMVLCIIGTCYAGFTVFYDIIMLSAMNIVQNVFPGSGSLFDGMLEGFDGTFEGSDFGGSFQFDF